MQEHQVARHQLFGRHGQALAAADRHCLRREHVPDGIQRPLGLAFLDEAEHRVDHDDAQDHRRVDPVRERGRDRRGSQQDVDQHVVELGEEPAQPPRPLYLRQAIRPEALEAPPRLVFGEAARPAREVSKDLADRHGVPGRWGQARRSARGFRLWSQAGCTVAHRDDRRGPIKVRDWGLSETNPAIELEAMRHALTQRQLARRNRPMLAGSGFCGHCGDQPSGEPGTAY